MKILIATGNQDKLSQFKRIFENLGSDIELLSLKDVGIFDDVEEDQETLLENAKKKAKFYAEKSGLKSLADDTGFYVDALNGEPGLHAKRWHEGSEKDRYMKILDLMNDISQEERQCSYKGALVLYDPKKDSFWEFENDLKGMVADEPLEDSGFGYDPIFISVDYDKYYSQMTDEERDAISHRGVGIKELLKHLSE